MKKIYVVIMCVVLVLSLFSCNLKDLTKQAFTYENFDKYTAGDTTVTSEVSAIEIDWISGNVEIIPGSTNGISVKESIETSSVNSPKLHWWLDGTVLRIKFSESGLINLIGLKKNLTVTVPDEAYFNDIDINAVSANISIEKITADTLDINSVSGKISLDASTVKEDIDISAVSGDIDIALALDTEDIDIETTSSAIDISAPSIGSFEADCVSSKVTVKVDGTLGNTEINTVSGGVKLTLPEDASFVLEFHSVSGDLDSEIALTTSADKHTAGDGENRYKVNTTSGDCEIRINK